MADLPTGTVTFLFTDVEGSTKQWERYPEAMQAAMARHDEVLREVMDSSGGYVFKTIGDAFCVAFSSASRCWTTSSRYSMLPRWSGSCSLCAPSSRFWPPAAAC